MTSLGGLGGAPFPPDPRPITEETMADVTITIPDPVIPRLKDALAGIEYNGITDPDDITVAEVKDYLRAQLQQLVNGQESREFAQTFTPTDLGTS